MKTLSLQI